MFSSIDGSSPLTRGKRNPSTSSAAAARLIPAHAGKTAVGYVVKSAAEAHPRSRGENGRIEVTDRAAPGSSPLTRGKHNHQSPVPHQAAAHPRSRGENGKGVNIAQPRLGSSPLTRGKPLAALITAANSGLIPAHAGKTSVGHCAIGCHWAHPRSRGENRVAVYEVTQTGGSSPLTRGKLSLAMHISSIPRLIPAHAGKTTLTASPRGSATAHPRSRGENDATNKFADTLRGSSPLTRGKPMSSLRWRRPCGLIPAHAGKTSRAGICSATWEAHPRSRGENHVLDVGGREDSGSSPLTRGKPCTRRRRAGRQRLIPAHAGKTAAQLSSTAESWAHPRSRGENRFSPPDWPDVSGSSPLTRGKQGRIQVPGRIRGLIPAHAGKTGSIAADCAARRAHPRSRGENRLYRRRLRGAPGSSPLTRGKLAALGIAICGFRLIPAHAGKTALTEQPAFLKEAHPRSRGENICSPCMPRALSGSSPLTRGKPWHVTRDGIVNGLIPAHAGKTPKRRQSLRGARAHPRSRGENDGNGSIRALSAGSSPLTRGKHQVSVLDGGRGRLIPAHAGKTRPCPHPGEA